MASEDLRDLIARHVETLRREAHDVARSMSPWLSGAPGGATGLAAAVGAAHKIKGSSGTIGFTEVADVARALEMRLRDAVAADNHGGGAARLEAERLLAKLSQRTAELKPEDSSLYDINLSPR